MRMNIDEKWKTDPRRTALVKRIGSRNADGMLVEIAWLLLAHKGEPVPLKEFQYIENYQDWIDCGLGKVVGEVVRVTGADEYSAFFDKQRANSAMGGQAMKAKAAQRSPKKPRGSPKSPSSSSSYSPSSSNSDSTSSSVNKSPESPATPVDVALTFKIWEAYSKAYFSRYHQEPVRNAKVNSQIVQLAKRLGDEAPDVVAFFVEHNRTFYIQKLHELGVCLTDAEGLRTQWARGKPITNSDLKRFERAVDNQTLDRMIDEGKI